MNKNIDHYTAIRNNVFEKYLSKNIVYFSWHIGK